MTGPLPPTGVPTTVAIWLPSGMLLRPRLVGRIGMCDSLADVLRRDTNALTVRATVGVPL